jgi:hypothetical protein
VFSCLTWASAPPGALLRSRTPVLRVIRSGRPRAYRTSRVLASSPPGVEPAPDPLRLSQQQADPGVLASPPVNNGRPCTCSRCRRISAIVLRKGRPPPSSAVTFRIPVPTSSGSSGTALPSGLIARQEV